MNNRPRMLEIVGLAGTGKSTLSRALRQRNEDIKIFPLPKTWFFWSLVKRSPLWLPLWLQNHREPGGFTREELICLGCIDAWLPYIQFKTSARASIAVLDPGSVYWLTKLKGFGSGGTGQSAYQQWRESKFEQWSMAVDVLIWLDAPEELCLQRILARDQWHDAKKMSAMEAIGRFRALRKSYEQIISKMVSRHPKKVFHFRTDKISTEEMVDEIFSEVNLGPGHPARTAKTGPSSEASDYITQPHINNSAFHTG